MFTCSTPETVKTKTPLKSLPGIATVHPAKDETMVSPWLMMSVFRIPESYAWRYGWWFRNPVNSPVEVGSLSTRIYRVLAPSQVVVWDFFHQQYFMKREGYKVYFNPAKSPSNWRGTAPCKTLNLKIPKHKTVYCKTWYSYIYIYIFILHIFH